MTKKLLCFLVVFSVVTWLAAFAQEQHDATQHHEHMAAAPSSAPVNIALTPDYLNGLPRTSVAVQTEHEKTKQTYEGVAFVEVLKKAGIAADKPLHGKELKKYLVVSAKDGYGVLLSLAEVDTAFRDRKILLADKVNGAGLDAEQGPLKLIIPDEAHPSRSVRMVTSLSLRSAD